jgi:hypothetical protein
MPGIMERFAAMKFENPINLQPSEAALALLQHFEQGPKGGFAPVIADALLRRDLIRLADGACNS